jgi:hypothetical protein
MVSCYFNEYIMTTSIGNSAENWISSFGNVDRLRQIASGFAHDATPKPTSPPLFSNVCKQAHFQTEIAPGIILHAIPGIQVSWQEFVATTPRGSIALDGFVRGASEFNSTTLHANYNHHEDVKREATRCTAMQVDYAIKEGVLDLFRVQGAPKLHIWVNDPDQDTALAVWLLANQERCAPYSNNPLIDALVDLEDKLDTSGGTYPRSPNDALMRKLAWIFEPYVNARQDHRIGVMKGNELANTIAAIGGRITDYVNGSGREIPLDTRLEILGTYEGWTMLKPLGFYALSQASSMGIKLYASYGGEIEPGRHKWTFGKVSSSHPLSMPDLCSYFNRLEGIFDPTQPQWGGGDRFAGSPRPSASSLDPDRMARVMNDYMTRWREERRLTESMSA